MSFSFDRCSCGRLNIHGATCVCESESRHDGAVGDARKRATQSGGMLGTMTDPYRGSGRQCPESWVPAEGGPGHQCAKPAGHDGLHDSAPAPVPDDTYRVYRKSNWQALAAEICDRLGERPSERHGEIAEAVLCSDWLAAHDREVAAGGGE